MAITHASDFTPVPQVMMEHARQAFVTRSNAMFGALVGGPGSIIESMGDPGFGMGGQYLESPTFNQVMVGTIVSRDITSDSAITASKMTGVNNRGVVVHRRTPLYQTVDDTRWAGFSNAQVSAELGRQLGENLVDDLCSTLIATLLGAVAAVGSSSNIYAPWNASARTNLDPDVIDDGRLKLGDRGNILTGIILRSQSMRDLRKDATGRAYDGVGARALAGVDGVNTFGLQLVQRDDALLTTADAGFDKYHTLLLGPGAIRFGFVQPVEIETIRVISNETKATQWRGDWSLVVHVPTLMYDGSTSGANPSNSGLATAANWTDTTVSNKEVPIVQITHNYSGN